MKKKFLVGYDYGMGGLWGGMWAKSAAEIRTSYPELDVYTGPPNWMTSEEFEQRRSRPPTMDIDDGPVGLLLVILDDRERDRQK